MIVAIAARPLDRNPKEQTFAPDPPANLQGTLAYGFPVDPRVVEKLGQEVFGEKVHDWEDDISIFWRSLVTITSSARPIYLKTRPAGEDHPERTGNFIIALGLNTSRKTMLLPQRDEIARLKRFMRTQDDPQWLRIA